MAKRVISARALRFLFASGVLRSKGSGKDRTVTYDNARAATVARNRKRGVDVTSRKKASQVNKSGRHVFGGSKAARLRSGSAPARRIPSKAERDATRAGRLAAGETRRDSFWGSKRGDRAYEGLNRAALHLSKKTGQDVNSLSGREINRTRLAQERAERTVQSIARSARLTYSGQWGMSGGRSRFRSNRQEKDAQRKRYALLKDRERRIRAKYGL